MRRDGTGMRISTRRLLLIGAVALLMVGLQVPSPAATARPAWVIPENLNVRSGPGTDRKLIASLTRGTKVYVTAFANNWCWAKLPDGRWGWISEPLLQFSQERGRELAEQAGGSSSAELDATPAWVKVDSVNVRSGPGTDYQSRGRLTRGTKLYVVEVRGDWRKCRTPGGYGWIRVDMLETNLSRGQQLGGSSSASSSSSGGTPSAKGYVIGDRVHLRSGPGTSYRIKALVVEGQTLYITETRGEWYNVTVHGGDAGWIHRDLVKLEAGSGSSGSSGAGGTAKGYVAAETVRLRAGPGTSYHVKAEVVEGQTLYITETRDGWCKVTVHGGEGGWIREDLVKLETAGSSQPATSRPAAPAAPSSGRAFEGVNAWIGEDSVNVRYGPGTDQDVKMKLSKGEKVQVLELSGHWCKIKTGSGSVGWVAGWVMNFKGPGEDVTVKEGDQEVPVRAGWVARPEVNIRSGPGTSYGQIAECALGTQVIILDKQGDWYKVALDNGTTGWMASWLIDTRGQRRVRQGLAGESGSDEGELEQAPRASLSTDTSLGRQAVEIAMQHLGASYARGTSGPRTFDCSGFTSYCYRQLGISISRASRAQAYEGESVPRDQLQVGDVIVFKNTYRAGPSHVGLYIGNGKFIHASNSRRGVVIDSLDSSYYAPRYHSARRVY